MVVQACHGFQVHSAHFSTVLFSFILYGLLFLLMKRVALLVLTGATDIGMLGDARLLKRQFFQLIKPCL
ncbi:hypothetical protein [Paraflavitalea speifideaquila]|uniref:hypothetical protein n=1 Tax=Paraflavitalea speifideaquila TaxID=3076558 RepID=UPI0028E78377|nr:hypothetical protein [Paraflavitalea speifideiaquila]